MSCIAPLGAVYQAGTLAGNPVAVAAGLATLELVQAAGFYDRLTATAQTLIAGLTKTAAKYGIAFSAQAVGGMFGLYFRDTPPTTYAEVMDCDREAFNRFFHACLQQRVYFAPSAYEAGFVSGAHGEDVVAATLAAADAAFAAI
jgi:glutamate-1-semialdehyde 2,1-aminomutase